MKKIMFLGLSLFSITLAFGQVSINMDTLTYSKWKEVLKSRFKIEGGCFLADYVSDSLFLPKEWCYDFDINNKTLFYPITSSIFILIMPHSAPIGSYFFYFDLKNKKKWCQINFPADSVTLLKFTPELYCIKLNKFDEIHERQDIRYVFFNIKKGNLLNKTIEAHGDSLYFKSFNTNCSQISFESGEKLITIDYSKMELVDDKSFLNNIIYTKSYYSHIIKLKRKKR